MIWPIVTASVRHERDIVEARQRSRIIAQAVGFGGQDQTRIATAVSEIARNAYIYGGGGLIEFAISDADRGYGLQIRVVDHGPGIDDVAHILEPGPRPGSSVGLGLAGAKRLMDELQVASSDRGTTVTMLKIVPSDGTFHMPEGLSGIMQDLAAGLPDPFEEVQRQNQELLRSLEALERREEALMAAYQDLQVATLALQRNVAEKEVLLREVYHRVKNNLQIIASLLNLQAAKIRDTGLRSHFDEIRSRVLTLSLIHDRLYQSADMARVNVGDYVRDLCGHLYKFHCPAGEAGGVSVDAEAMELPLDAALHLGLVVNEILSPAFRASAAAGTACDSHISVGLHHTDQALTLTFRDDGPAQTRLRPDPATGQLGAVLLQSLLRRLDGAQMSEEREGTVLTITVPLPIAG